MEIMRLAKMGAPKTLAPVQMKQGDVKMVSPRNIEPINTMESK